MNQEETIISIIQEKLEVDRDEITNESLLSDLGADELEIVDIITEIEKKLSISLDGEDFDITVNDLFKMAKEANTNKVKLLDKPRKLHYVFVHRLLRDLIFKEGISLFAELRVNGGYDFMPGSKMIAGLDLNGNHISDGKDYLLQFWNRLSSDLNCEYISPHKLDYEITERENMLILFFIFPEPLAVGEAYYSLFIWNNKLAQGSSSAEMNANGASYYTLELSYNNGTVLGKWERTGAHYSHYNLGSYESILTPTQFLDQVLDKHKTNENQSVVSNIYIDLQKAIDKEIKNTFNNHNYMKYGRIDENHIYSRIILSIANQLKITVTELNKNSPINNLKRKDYIEIVHNVYKIYNISNQDLLPKIEYFVDELIEEKDELIDEEDWFNCGFIVLKICNYFEAQIMGPFDNPAAIYSDYRAKLLLLLQSPEFAILHDLIATMAPSLLGESVNQEILKQKELLFKEILTMPEDFLLHNYPIEPRGLFICLLSTAIAHYKYTKSEEKATALIKSAIELNTKWGPFIEPSLLDNIKNNSAEQIPIEKTKNGCFIATAVYGTPLATEVILLKEFRDNWLVNYTLGRIFIKFYYKISPSIANQIVQRKYLKVLTKLILIVPLLKLAKQLKRKDK